MNLSYLYKSIPSNFCCLCHVSHNLKENISASIFYKLLNLLIYIYIFFFTGIAYTVEILVALVLLLVVEGTGTAQRLLGELIRVHKRLFLSFRYGRVRYKFEKLFTKTQKREVEKTTLLARDGMKREIEGEGIKRKESLSDSSSVKKKACWTQMQLAFHIPSASEDSFGYIQFACCVIYIYIHIYTCSLPRLSLFSIF